MSEDKQSTNSKFLEYTAFLAVIAFGVVMVYAIRVTAQTASDIEANHYNAVSIEAESDQAPQDSPTPDRQ